MPVHPYDNLLTVDFVCHGTPSPKVWSMYLGKVISEGRRISNIEFRSKSKGWNKFSFHLKYNEDDKTITGRNDRNEIYKHRKVLSQGNYASVMEN